MALNASNQKMEQTASGRNNLPFGGLDSYPIAMVSLARDELIQPNWSKGWSYHRGDRNWPEHHLAVGSAARRRS